MRTVDRDLLIAFAVTAVLIGALIVWPRTGAAARRFGWTPAGRKLARAAARLKRWWLKDV